MPKNKLIIEFKNVGADDPVRPENEKIELTKHVGAILIARKNKINRKNKKERQKWKKN
ncbi:MAG: hypothetical protein ACI4UE_07025 [Candidatus Scatovivens sp.]